MTAKQIKMLTKIRKHQPCYIMDYHHAGTLRIRQQGFGLSCNRITLESLIKHGLIKQSAHDHKYRVTPLGEELLS